MLEAGATGLPSIGFRWTPTPKRGAWRDKATADSKASPFANRLVLLIKPQKCPSMIAWLTCVVKPKSSALTINRFIYIRGPWDGDLSSCRLLLAKYRILWHQMNPQANPNESPGLPNQGQGRSIHPGTPQRIHHQCRSAFINPETQREEGKNDGHNFVAFSMSLHNGSLYSKKSPVTTVNGGAARWMISEKGGVHVGYRANRAGISHEETVK